MRTVTLILALFLATPFVVRPQQPSDTPAPDAAKVPAASAPKSSQTSYVRPDSRERFRRYLNGMFGPVAMAKKVAFAGIGTWTNWPEEWGPHWDGYGRRFATSIGSGIIENSISYGLDEAFKLDSHYVRSSKKDVGSKVKNALISPVLARNKNGKRVFGFPRIAGVYTAHVIAVETWYPARYDYTDGLKSATFSLGMTAAFNLVKEFIWKR